MATKANRIVRAIVITLISIGTIVFGYLLINNFQFRRGVSVRVHFESVGDLAVGAWVRKGGLKVGSITKMEIDKTDEKTVIATVTFKPGQAVRVDDKFSIISKGLLGDMYMEVVPGPLTSAAVEAGHWFEGEPVFDLGSLLGSGAGMLKDLGDSINAIAEFLRKNEDALQNSMQNIDAAIANTRKVTESAVSVTQAVPQMTSSILSSVKELETTVSRFTSATDSLIDRLTSQLGSGSADLAESLKSIRKISTDVEGIVAGLTAKDSLVGSLSSPATSQNVATILKNLEDTSRALLSVSQETERIMTDIRKSFEGK
jgi:phospholipid/cholesterol/gamma-HCH transport system substrate-binding protein